MHQRVVQIIREEMDAIGGQEMLMPVLHAGRAVAAHRPLRRSTSCSSCSDRKGAELVLAMTHEEAVTFHVARSVRSYRDLPLILYHFQIKERDEPRPRAGVLRTREFIMKDSYSFDRDADGPARRATSSTSGAYDRIFDRCGLDWYRVESDVGMMGGTGRARVHGAVPGRRERRRAGARLRRQRRGRQRRARGRSPALGGLDRRAAHARA